MKIYITASVLVLTCAAILSLLVLFALRNDHALGSAPSGLPATVATSTEDQAVTAATAELLFATSTGCTNRLIGTDNSAIKLTFSDKEGARPTGEIGFPQAASTTVAYDSGLYGCGAIWVYSYGTQGLTITELY